MERRWEAGLNFFKCFTPNLGITVVKFFGNLFTDVFNSIYNQQIDKKVQETLSLDFFVLVGVTTVIIAGFNRI